MVNAGETTTTLHAGARRRHPPDRGTRRQADKERSPRIPGPAVALVRQRRIPLRRQADRQLVPGGIALADRNPGRVQRPAREHEGTGQGSTASRARRQAPLSRTSRTGRPDREEHPAVFGLVLRGQADRPATAAHQVTATQNWTLCARCVALRHGW